MKDCQQAEAQETVGTPTKGSVGSCGGVFHATNTVAYFTKPKGQRATEATTSRYEDAKPLYIAHDLEHVDARDNHDATRKK